MKRINRKAVTSFSPVNKTARGAPTSTRAAQTILRHEYRVVWFWRGRRCSEKRGSLGELCKLLLVGFGPDAEVRRAGRSYEVLGANGVVARLCVDVYSEAWLRGRLAGERAS